jgi:hypothetical protein
LEDANGVQAQINSKRNQHFSSPGGNQGNMISDSWQAINAKLQYEKHMQDTGGNNSPMQNNVKHGIINNSTQRREFYQNGGSGSNSNMSSAHNQSSSARISDLQTSFGEILSSGTSASASSAPAAFSPQFTRKNYPFKGNSSANGNGSNQVISPQIGHSSDNEGSDSHNGKHGLSHSKSGIPKTVFIRGISADHTNASEGMNRDAMFGGINSAIGKLI